MSSPATNGCPTCGKKFTTWYECHACHAVGCNDCWSKNGSKCRGCGKSGHKTVSKH